MEIIVLGYEYCVNCPIAWEYAKRFAEEYGLKARYLEVFKDDYATRLYNEAVKHGYEGVPQVYVVVNGVEYFIMLGVPDTYMEFKQAVLEMLEYYGLGICNEQTSISKTEQGR